MTPKVFPYKENFRINYFEWYSNTYDIYIYTYIHICVRCSVKPNPNWIGTLYHTFPTIP